MSDRLVALVNPNKVHPPVAPYALDVLTTSLEHAGFDVDVVDLTFRRTDWSVALAEYFRRRRPMLVGVTIRNTDSVYALEQRSFLGEHKEIVDRLRELSDAPIVAGGIGFSTMPFALTEYLGLDFGVQGPGENIIVDLATAVRENRSPRTVPGLIVNDGGDLSQVPPQPVPTGRVASARHSRDRVWQVDVGRAYTRRSGVPSKVDNLAYYRAGGLGAILTKNGCAYQCSHCVEPAAKGTRFARRGTAAVVDEMESLAAQGIHDLHTADSEFNLAIATSKALLREVARRKDGDRSSPLHRMRLWIYCQPAPFDEEFAELLAAAGCAGVNVGADHVRRDILDGWKVTGKGTRYYGYEDTVRLVKLCHKYGMLTMVEALLGMPGETLDSMRECVDRFLALDATVTGFSLGLRLFPYTRLGISLAERCDGVRTVPGLQSNTADRPIVLRPLRACASRAEYERQFVFDESGGVRLVCYFSPDLPEDPDTLGNPSGRWHRSVAALWDSVPPALRYRVMLPTVAGVSEHDNNYADNPFLTSALDNGHTGAFWAHWRDREELLSREVSGDRNGS